MKIKTFLLISVIVMFALFIVLKIGNQPKDSMIEPITDTTKDNHYGDTMQIQDKRNALYEFIVSKLSGSYGIYTNYLDSDQNLNMATGHEVLSESEGLMLRYYAMTRQQDAFDKEWALVEHNLNLSSGFSYRYSPKLNKRYTLNAAVDDLRIIRALYEAGVVFEDPQYTEQANQYGTRFYESNVKDGYLYDFYDEKCKVRHAFITLCYINLTTLEQLPLSSDHIQQISTNMLEIIQNGYLSDSFPLYKTRYQYETNSYNSENINTVESLLTILSLAEVKQQNPSSIWYLKEHVKKGTLYG